MANENDMLLAESECIQQIKFRLAESDIIVETKE